MTRARLDANPNVPTSARANEVAVTSANAPTPTVAERLRADAVGTAAVDAQATPAGIAAREIMTRAGLQRAASGQTTVQDSASIGRSAEVAGLNAREQIYGTQTALLNPPSAPFVEFTNNTRVGAASFAQNIGTATDNFLIRRMDAGGRPELYRDLNQLSPDQLLAAFLKINITDPNDNPATQNKLYEISTEMRQLAIVEAKKKIENAREQQKEAEAYAQQAQYVSQIVQVVSIALTVFTFGSSLVAMQAAQAATQQVMTNVVANQVSTAMSAQVNALAQQIMDTALKNGVTMTIEQAQQLAVQQIVQNLTVEQTTQLMQKGLEDMVTKAMTEAGGNLTSEQAMNQVTNQLAGQIVAEAAKTGTTITLDQAKQVLVQQVMANPAYLNAFSNTFGKELVTQQFKAIVGGPMQQLSAKLGLNFTNPNMQMASTAVSAGGQVADASAQAKLADMQLQARQTELEARRWELVADQAQAQVDSSAQVINTMMQSRNQVIDNVMQMSQNQHVTAMRIQSAGMSR